MEKFNIDDEVKMLAGSFAGKVGVIIRDKSDYLGDRYAVNIKGTLWFMYITVN